VYAALHGTMRQDRAGHDARTVHAPVSRGVLVHQKAPRDVTGTRTAREKAVGDAAAQGLDGVH